MSEPPPKPLKEWLGIAETVVKIVMLPAVAIWAVIEFSTGASLDAKRPFLEAQLRYCTDASSAAAVIATTDDDALFRQNRAEFLRLYFGPLVIVEDAVVEAAMIDYKSALDGGGSCQDLQNRSLAIAEACLGLVQSSWPVLPGQLDAAQEAVRNRLLRESDPKAAGASATCAARP
jgi:hypothetical protein